MSEKSKLYLIFLIACFSGYLYLYVSFQTNVQGNHSDIEVCLIKQIIGIPCPSCGSTRSIFAFLEGNVLDALYWNPIGLIVLFIMIGSPFWVMYDILFKKNTLFLFYKKFERKIRQKKYAIIAIVLILINWIWNIYKGV